MGEAVPGIIDPGAIVAGVPGPGIIDPGAIVAGTVDRGPVVPATVDRGPPVVPACRARGLRPRQPRVALRLPWALLSDPFGVGNARLGDRWVGRPRPQSQTYRSS